MRNLDLTSLRSFVAVVESGGVTRAAQAVNKSQSAVSMQLKRLEDLLGVALHERRGRQLVLTEAGDQLLVDAKRMLAINDDVFARMTDHAFEGEILLGVPSDIIHPIVPVALKRFHAEFSGIKVQLISSYTRVLKDKFKKIVSIKKVGYGESLNVAIAGSILMKDIKKKKKRGIHQRSPPLLVLVNFYMIK